MMSVFRSFELLLTSDIGMFRRCKGRRFPCLYAGTLALDHLADKTERASSEPYGRLTGRLKDRGISSPLQLEQSVTRPVIRFGREL